MKISLDTNVLVYAANADTSEKHGTALRLLDKAIDVDSVLALQSLAELFNVLTKLKALAVPKARRAVEHVEKNFLIARADEGCLFEAMAAVEDHTISFWDAMLWATVRAAGCGLLLSEDLQDGRQLGGVLIINPFNPANAEQVAELLTA